ncbi:MAG TPA: transposase [Thermoanaerobaculia bacterium]|nr:transposase [Thermoanaerobaculia bacterium]
MGRPLRFLPDGALVEITCRTVQGRLLLRPSPHLNELVLGVLGRAQARYGMVLHAFVVLSNHLHLLLSPGSPRQLARFMAFVGANVAKEAGRLHDWKGPFWARRYQAIVVSDEEPAQVGRLFYILRHGVKEHLVARPQDWPGAHAVTALLEGSPLTGLWIDRTLEHRLRRKCGEPDPRSWRSIESVVLSPLPCWRDLPRDAYRARVAELVAEVEAEGTRLAEEKGEPLGRDRVQRQQPHERPMSSKHSPAPFVHAACRAVRLAFLEAYRLFVVAFRGAADRLRAGDRFAVFPDGAFPPPLPTSG